MIRIPSSRSIRLTLEAFLFWALLGLVASAPFLIRQSGVIEALNDLLVEILGSDTHL